MTEKSGYNCSQLTAHSSQPRLVFINYANEQYIYQQKFALWTAKKLGCFSEVIAYGPEAIDDDFRSANREILSITRGNGLWIWKPYIILDALAHVNEGDYVFYCDSGAFFFSSVKPLIESMGDSDVWGCNGSLIEEQWTKPQVFEKLGITDESIRTSQQIGGGFVMCRKSENSVQFIREWLNLCTRPELIKPLEPDEYAGECIWHREDQSLLSVLCKMRGIVPHKYPAIFPNNIPRRIVLLKNKVKSLLSVKKTPASSTSSEWKDVKNVPPMNSDTYEPNIYLHRIRTARNIPHLVVKLIIGLGVARTVKIFMFARKDK